jgi:hypothetical protein
MKIDVSKFDNVEDFCKTFSCMNGCFKLSFLYENWTDYFCRTFSKQHVLDCCENYNSKLCDNSPIIGIIEGLYEENDEDHDCCLDDD